jgi:hypothetical protein
MGFFEQHTGSSTAPYPDLFLDRNHVMEIWRQAAQAGLQMPRRLFPPQAMGKWTGQGVLT